MLLPPTELLTATCYYYISPNTLQTRSPANAAPPFRPSSMSLRTCPLFTAVHCRHLMPTGCHIQYIRPPHNTMFLSHRDSLQLSPSNTHTCSVITCSYFSQPPMPSC